MEFKTLKYFLAVCKAGTMSRAAEELHVTQPTLSRQIADLERELGCALLLRHSRSVEPTEEGLYLMRRAQDVIGLMGRIESDFAASEEIIAGDISIGACESSSMRLVAHLVAPELTGRGGQEIHHNGRAYQGEHPLPAKTIC